MLESLFGKHDRVIIHVDNDAFYSQVESRRDPSLASRPLGIVQYNPYGDLSSYGPSDPRRRMDHSNGSLIAVSYAARAWGVKRNMRGDQARKLCPSIALVQVPTHLGKADLKLYRDAGAEVVRVLCSMGITERASVDESYVDITVEAKRRLEAWMEENGGDPEARIPFPQDPGCCHVALPETDGTGSSTTPHPLYGAALEEDEGEGEGEEEADWGGDSDRLVPDAGWAAGGQAHAGPSSARPSRSPSPRPGRPGTEATGAAAAAAATASTGAALGPEPSVPSATVETWFGRPLRAIPPCDLLLAFGAIAVAELRARVRRETGFTCSAGVGPNKLIAKLGSGLKKPNQQTVVPTASIPTLLAPLPISRIRSLGGKLGEEVAARLNISTVGQLAAVPLARLISLFGEDRARALHRLAAGQDDAEVKDRTLAKSINNGKTFRGPGGGGQLKTLQDAEHWLGEICTEVRIRAEEDHSQHGRRPTLISVGIYLEGSGGGWQGGQQHSRSGPLQSIEAIFTAARREFRRWAAATEAWGTEAGPGITSLFVTVSDFLEEAKGVAPITSFFKQQPQGQPNAAAAAAAAAARPALQSAPPQPSQPPQPWGRPPLEDASLGLHDPASSDFTLSLRPWIEEGPHQTQPQHRHHSDQRQPGPASTPPPSPFAFLAAAGPSRSEAGPSREQDRARDHPGALDASGAADPGGTEEELGGEEGPPEAVLSPGHRAARPGKESRGSDEGGVMVSMDDIDRSVLDSLPLELRREVLLSAGAPRRPLHGPGQAAAGSKRPRWPQGAGHGAKKRATQGGGLDIRAALARAKQT